MALDESRVLDYGMWTMATTKRVTIIQRSEAGNPVGSLVCAPNVARGLCELAVLAAPVGHCFEILTESGALHGVYIARGND